MSEKILALAAILLLAVGYLTGYKMRDNSAERELAELQSTQVKTLLELQQRAYDLEKQNTAAAVNAQQAFKKTDELLSARHDMLVRDLDRMQHPNSGTAGNNQDGATDIAAGAEPDGAYRSDGAAKRDFERLQRKALDIGLKCDQTAARYNELLKLYNTVKQNIENQSNKAP